MLLRNAPHIIWPLRFVLPHHAGLRPWWLIRLGLFLYDHLGGRALLPPCKSVDLGRHVSGRALKKRYRRGFEYSDCWVQDSRLVVLNARDAHSRGAEVRTRTECVSLARRGSRWEATLVDGATGARFVVSARGVVNASGPWVGKTLDLDTGADCEPRRETRERKPHRRQEDVRSSLPLHLPERGRTGVVRDPLRRGLHPARNHRRGDRGTSATGRDHFRGGRLHLCGGQCVLREAALHRRRRVVVLRHSSAVRRSGAQRERGHPRLRASARPGSGAHALGVRRQDHDLSQARRAGRRPACRASGLRPAGVDP